MNGLRHFTVRNCEFYDNFGHYDTAIDMHVGELSLTASGPQVYNNYIHGNHGNTMYLGWEGVGRLHDNVIVNNDGYSPVLGTTAPNYSHYYNNTIANNLSEGHIHGYGSGIWTNGQQKIYNNVFWGNTGVWFERMDPNHPDPTVFSNCNGTISGTGDVFGDPQFVNPTSGYGPQYDVATTAIHWKLQQTSPCINAGATSNTSFYPETDFAGDPRVVNGRIDMGAFEFPDLDAVEENDSDKVVYPNPGSDFFVVLTEAGETLLVVYDLAGQKVYESRCQGNATTVATQDWPSGMYFWRLSGSSAPTKTGKWIKK